MNAIHALYQLSYGPTEIGALSSTVFWPEQAEMRSRCWVHDRPLGRLIQMARGGCPPIALSETCLQTSAHGRGWASRPDL